MKKLNDVHLTVNIYNLIKNCYNIICVDRNISKLRTYLFGNVISRKRERKREREMRFIELLRTWIYKFTNRYVVFLVENKIPR